MPSIEIIKQLLTQEAELTYEQIPMAGENQSLLTAEYPLTAIAFEEREVYPIVRIWLDEEETIDSVILSWSRPGIKSEEGFLRDSDLVTISFKPYEGSVDYQAERKVWSFGYDHGLSEEGVPALSTQEDDREFCQKIIGGMKYEKLKETGTQDTALAFPASFGEKK